MRAIYKRELKNYLNNPMGYVFLGIFTLMFSGIFCYTNLYLYTSSDISHTFSIMIYLMMVLMPLLTMRLISEEKAEKTDQLLLCAPVSALDIVYGKFLAAMTLIGVALLFTVPHLVILSIQGNPQIGTTLLSYFGFFIYSAVYAAIGIFISSLTENQVISAVFSFAVFIGMIAVEIFVVPTIQNPALYAVLGSISFATRYLDFSLGILNISSLVYYISIAALFNYFTVRVIEKRRW